MGLFDIFKKQEIRTKSAPKIMINKLDAYAGKSSKSYKAQAKEGYQDNAIVHRCIRLIADSSSAVKLCVYQGDEKLESHQLLSLLHRPNPLQSGTEYFASLYSYLLIPDRIDIKSSTSMIPAQYDYIINGVIANSYPVDQSTGYSQIKHIKLWSPLDDYYGLSPLMASAYNIDQHNLAGLHNVALLKNGCTPSGMLKFEPTDETGASASLTDDQRARLLEDLEFRFQGSQNSGRPMLLEGNFEYKQLGLNPKDMDFLELLNLSAREIALAFGVPAQMLGIPEANTYSNMETAKLGLYEETIIPLLTRVESDLNEFLVPLYDDDIRIKYDIDSIPAMAEKTKQVYLDVSQAVTAGIITRNEAREKLGLQPIDGANELYIPSNLFPIGQADDDTPLEDDDNEKLADLAYGTKARVDVDTFTTEEEAEERAEEIGCEGIHSHDKDGQKVYMPCKTHREYESLLADGKALSDLDLVPTDTMASNAKKGLEMRKEFNRGGTAVGVARANQLVNKDNLSPDTVLRMYSFFSRHEVDKQGRGFNSGTDGYPSAGKIAWQLWGGDAGFSWSKTKRNQIMKEREGKAESDALKVGDMVSWDSSGGRAKGKITRIVRSGSLSVPKTSFTLNATEDNPACLIKVYRGDEPTDTIVGHRFRTLRKL